MKKALLLWKRALLTDKMAALILSPSERGLPYSATPSYHVICSGRIVAKKNTPGMTFTQFYFKILFLLSFTKFGNTFVVGVEVPSHTWCATQSNFTGKVTILPRPSSVLSGGCPYLGSKLAARPSTFLLTNSVLERQCTCPQRGLWVAPLERVP